MRPLAGTQNNSTAGTAVQFVTTDAPRSTGAMFTARPDNSQFIYIGTDSGVSSAAGIQLRAGESITVPGTFKPSAFWMVGTDTTQLCDYIFAMEN